MIYNTHTHIYIYIYIYMCILIYINFNLICLVFVQFAHSTLLQASTANSADLAAWLTTFDKSVASNAVFLALLE